MIGMTACAMPAFAGESMSLRPGLEQPRIQLAQSCGTCSNRESMSACIACMQSYNMNYSVAESKCGSLWPSCGGSKKR